MSLSNPGPYFPPYSKYHPTFGGIGWARYDDTQYTSAGSALTITAGAAAVTLPNNAGTVINTYKNSLIEYYNGSTQKVRVEYPGEQYNMVVAFQAQSGATNNCYFELSLDSTGTTPYERVSITDRFAKANNETQNFYYDFRFYADEDFVTNGNRWKISCAGADMIVFNVIYYIERVSVV